MKEILFFDFEANLNLINFQKEAELLDLNYCFKHTFEIQELNNSENIVITDKAALNYLNQLKSKNIYLWITEPEVIHPHIYQLAIKENTKFKKVFSHNRDFCNSIPNGFWYPWGSYFIPLNEQKIYEKNKNSSIVCSSKLWTDGHHFRHKCFEMTKKLLDGYKYGDPVEQKLTWHKDYRYSIAVENCFVKGYFTEKILDCFRTGTIPIYKGDSEIINYFNKDGIILFTEPEELIDILSYIDVKYYNDRIEVIKENFIKAEPFLYPWKYIKENYLNEI